MKFLFIKVIILYQDWISPLTKPACKFYPTCSEYAKEAIQKYGVLKGSYLATLRILRCHPWQDNHLDLVK